jgi:hypothetical protein
MGHGDETNYVYLIQTKSMPTLLAHMASSLDHSDYKIDNADVDRKAAVEFEGVQYEIPIYAISNNHFSGKDGFRQEKDIRAVLKTNGPAIKFDSGVWCKPDNILDEDQAERTASKGKKDFRLTHIEFELALGAEFARLTLSVWGGVYWGGTESDPSFAKLTKPLKSMCAVWIVQDETGAYCNKPKMNEETQEQFGEFFQENDYFEDAEPDAFAEAVLEFKLED